MEAGSVKMEERAEEEEEEGGMEVEENGEAKTSVKTMFSLPAEIIEHIVSYLSLQVRDPPADRQTTR